VRRATAFHAIRWGGKQTESRPTRERRCKKARSVLSRRESLESRGGPAIRVYKVIFGIISAVTCVSITLLVTPAAVINQDASLPALEINVPPDIPVRIMHFQFDPSPRGMTAFHYDVQNLSGQGLVAVEVRWQTQSRDHPRADFTNQDDRWLTGLLASNDFARFRVTNVSSPATQPLTRLTGAIAYAEFEDGTRLGTDGAAVGQKIKQERKATLAGYGKLLETFNIGGGEALTQALKQQAAAAPALGPSHPGGYRPLARHAGRPGRGRRGAGTPAGIEAQRPEPRP